MKHIIFLKANALELYSFFADNQDLKSLKQIENSYKITMDAFSIKSSDSLQDNWNKTIFNLKEGLEQLLMFKFILIIAEIFK